MSLAEEVYQALQEADPPFDEGNAITKLFENRLKPETDIKKIFFKDEPTAENNAPKEDENGPDIIESHKSKTNTKRASPSQGLDTTRRQPPKRPRRHSSQPTAVVNSSAMPIIIHDEEDAVNSSSAHFPPLPTPAKEASSSLFSPRSIDSVSDPLDTSHKSIGVESLKSRPSSTNSPPLGVSSKRRTNRISRSKQVSITTYTRPVVPPRPVIPCNTRGIQEVHSWLKNSLRDQHRDISGSSNPLIPSPPPGATGPNEYWGLHEVNQGNKAQNGLSIGSLSKQDSERLFDDESSEPNSPITSEVETNTIETQSRLDAVQQEKLVDGGDTVMVECELESKHPLRDDRKQRRRFLSEAPSKRVTRSVLEPEAIEDDDPAWEVQDKLKQGYNLTRLPQERYTPSSITEVPASPSPPLAPKQENNEQVKDIVNDQLDSLVKKNNGMSGMIHSQPKALSSLTVEEVEFEGVNAEMEVQEIPPPSPTSKRSSRKKAPRTVEKESAPPEGTKPPRAIKRRKSTYVVAEQDGTGGEQELEQVQETRQKRRRH